MLKIIPGLERKSALQREPSFKVPSLIWTIVGMLRWIFQTLPTGTVIGICVIIIFFPVVCAFANDAKAISIKRNVFSIELVFYFFPSPENENTFSINVEYPPVDLLE